MNRLAYMKHRLGSPSDPISGERILEIAQKKTGLDDFGPGSAREGLNVLARSFDEEAGLHPWGRRVKFGELVHRAATRLRIVDYLKQHPDVRDDEIRKPLLVSGFPRTGTTLLHNLLAQDPRARPLLAWEAVNPVPTNYNKPGSPDTRLSNLKRAARGIRYLAPEFEKLHAIHADGPEECFGLLRNSFVSNVDEFFMDPLPSYSDWLRGQQPKAVLEAYAFYRGQLQILQREGPQGHFALKSPVHFANLGAFFQLMGDAAVILTHRDPVQVLPSICSLFAIARGFTRDQIVPELLGPETLAESEAIQNQVLEIRDQLPEKQVIDVRYADLVKRPMEVVREIYEYLGYPFSTEMEERIERWLRENPQHKHGRHRYRAEQFGLTNERIREVLAPYCERFGV